MSKIITYKDMDWYEIDKTDEGSILLLQDSFTNEQIRRFFDRFDDDFDVQFNSDFRKIWWIDSYIREILNGPFLEFLGKDNLNLMKTTLELNGQESYSEDFVRLPRKREVIRLQKEDLEILKTKREYGYWTMDPSYFFGSYALVFYVYGSSNPGYLDIGYVNFTRAVRPVISLKSETLKSILSEAEEEKEIQELIKMIYVLNNNIVNETTWVKYYLKYNSIKDFTGSTRFIALREILASSLINAKLSSSAIEKIESLNEKRKVIEEDLGHSKKLII